MSARSDQLSAFYRKERIDDQFGFYTGRRTLFDCAAGQVIAVSAVLLGFATGAGALAGTNVGPRWLWTVLATVLPAASTALAAYGALYAFEQQSKIYGDAARAVRAAARAVPDADPAAPRSPDEKVADLVRRVEMVFRQEQAQWGQLTAQIEIADETRS